MEGEPYDVVPCSSVTVDSILRIGTAGAIWGLCAGPHDARKQGLAGAAQVAFVARSAGTFGVQYGESCGFWCSSRGSHCRYDTKLDAGDSFGLSAFKVATDYARAVCNFEMPLGGKLCGRGSAEQDVPSNIT